MLSGVGIKEQVLVTAQVLSIGLSSADFVMHLKVVLCLELWEV